MPTSYSTAVTVDGGRNGHAASADGRLDLDLSVPKAFGGDDGPGTNPEQLFAAGYAACFQTALRHIAAQRGFEISLPGLPGDAARELAEAVHAGVCPYSKALEGNVDVELTIR